MRDVQDLYLARAKAAWLNGIGILMKILANQGTLITGIAVIIGSAFIYAYLLRELPNDFPSALLMSALMSYVLVRNRARTFLKEADLVFLLPAEQRLEGYFRYSYRYSLFFQIIQVLLATIAFLPLYHAQIGELPSFLLTAAALLLLKVWNFDGYWRRLLATRTNVLFPILYYGTNLLLTYSLLTERWLWLLGALVLGAAVTLFERRRHHRRGYPWQLLVNQEQKALASYYAIANFFVDIPQLKHQVKPRTYLTPLLRRIPGDRERPYQFLYTRTFFRYSEYYGIYLRLVSFICVALFFVTNYWVSLFFYIIGLYMMAFQLPMLATERRYPDLLRTYPLTLQQKLQGISTLAFLLLALQSIIQLLAMLRHYPPLTLLIFLAIGLLYSYQQSRHTVPKRFQQKEGSVS